MEENKITETDEELDDELLDDDGTEDEGGDELPDDDNPFSLVEDEDEEEDEDEDSDEEDEDEKGDGGDSSATNETELEREAKVLLKKLGMADGEDPIAAAKRFIDEADGIDPERRAWEERAKADIAAIHEAFPETKQYKSLDELPNKLAFARAMDDKSKNRSAVDAFIETHGEIVKAHIAGQNHKQKLAGTKGHLQTSVPRGSGGEAISDKELRALKREFPEMTDKDIRRYYKKING